MTDPLPSGAKRVYQYTYRVLPSALGQVTFTASATATFDEGPGTVTSQNPAATATVQVVTDADAPSTQLSVSGTPGNSSTVGNTLVQWWVSPLRITLTATDTGSGVAFIQYQIDRGGSPPGTAAASSVTFDLDLQGPTTITYWAQDRAGNAETAHAETVWVDSVAPTITMGGVTPLPNTFGWNNVYPTVSFFASDSGSGKAASTPDVLVATDGPNQVVTGSVTDKAGNHATTTGTVHVDTKAPSLVCAPTVPSNALGWYTNQATVTVLCTAVDQPGLSGILQVSAVCPSAVGTTTPPHTGVPSTGPQSATATCTISAEGDHQVHGEASDVAGNLTISPTFHLRIDRTPPTVVCGTASGGNIWPPNHKMVQWDTFVQVTDLVSGSAGFKLTGYSSSEVVNGKGDGNTSVDMTNWTLGTPDTSGFVRSERAGPGTGRVYRLFYVGADAAGNTTSCASVLTEVPHDQGKKK